MINALPSTLDEAIETLLAFYEKAIPEISEMTLEKFRASSHFGAGMFIRNSWYLWWYEGHKYGSWPDTQPPLNTWFKTIGIVHADDMSGILMECIYKKIHNLPYDLESQVAHYQAHWKSYGFEDGIPIH